MAAESKSTIASGEDAENAVIVATIVANSDKVIPESKIDTQKEMVQITRK
jgi:hypothetical protein